MVKVAVKREAGKRPAGGKKTGAANRGHKKGQGALRAGSAFAKSNASAKAGRTTPNGETRAGAGSNFRSEGTIKRLKMYKDKPNIKKMKEQSLKPVRIQPDRRWFGNTRTIAQNKMQAFRETLSKDVQDPFSVVLKSSKLPMSLLKETEDNSSRMKLLSVEPYNEVFGKKRKQKRAKLGSYDLEGLLQSVDKKTEEYRGDQDKTSHVDPSTGHDRAANDEGTHASEEIFGAGTSKRIWRELYKVVDSSDIIVEVLDARDPMGTRCLSLEKEIRKTRAHKHIVLVLNKVDLVPTWVSRRWIQELMKEYPTLAFHASITNPFGKNALLNLLRQFGNLLKEKKHVTVGFIGYPNVGKSSVINAMKKKKVCKAAPIPGETKVWQYIGLSNRIYLLDCPGIVPAAASDFANDAAKVLKGVVRAERVSTPSDYIDEVLTRVKRQYLLARFKLPPDTTWKDGEDFLSIIGRRMGKLLKGGDPDLETAARIVLYDWQRGRIPYFTPPPGEPPTQGQAEASEAAQAEAKDAAETAEGAGDGTVQTPSVDQQLGQLACVMEFDDEDLRGETLALQTIERAKRRAEGEGDEGPEQKPKKKARRGKGGKGTKPGHTPGGGTAAVKPGSVDWGAVVAEFGM